MLIVPPLAWPDVPLTVEARRILLPYVAAIAAVGLLESLSAAPIVDDVTDTPFSKNRECVGQGVANVASALFGGMGGCAMIGQSVIDVSSGARGRLWTLVASAVLLVLLEDGRDPIIAAPAPGQHRQSVEDLGLR